MVETQIQTNLPTQPRERTLELLGVALHPLEDSWSHQGEPAIPIACSADYAFGHPVSRGGWLKHDADLTYLHETPDTVEMARRTYEKLVKFLGNHPTLRDHHATAWAGLEPQVLKFAKAASKADKLSWFQEQKGVPFNSYTTYPNFLKADRSTRFLALACFESERRIRRLEICFQDRRQRSTNGWGRICDTVLKFVDCGAEPSESSEVC